MGVSPEQAPDKPAYVKISFEKGIPVAVDGEKLTPVALLEKLNKLGGENGVGLVDLVENRLVGMKSRGVYETPGGTLLYRAHQVLETLCLDRDTQHYKELVANRFAELVYFGQWFTAPPARGAFRLRNQNAGARNRRRDAETVQGQRHQRGRNQPVQPVQRGNRHLRAGSMYDQKNSAGFITLFGLPVAVQAKLQKKL